MTTLFDNLGNRELLRLLTKSLLMLEISDDPVLRNDLIANVDRMLEQTLELKTKSNLNMFKQSLEGNRISEEITFSSTARPSTFDEIATGEEGSALVADVSVVDEMDNSVNDQSRVSADKNADENTSILVTSPRIESAAHETVADDTTGSPSASPTQSPPSKRPTSKRKTKPIEIPNTLNPNAAAPKTPTSKTPTTYGLNNSTQTRNLRKSMHTQRLSVADEVSRKQSQSARRANDRGVRSGNRAAPTQQVNNNEDDGNNEVEDTVENDKEVIFNMHIAKKNHFKCIFLRTLMCKVTRTLYRQRHHHLHIIL